MDEMKYKFVKISGKWAQIVRITKNGNEYCAYIPVSYDGDRSALKMLKELKWDIIESELICVVSKWEISYEEVLECIAVIEGYKKALSLNESLMDILPDCINEQIENIVWECQVEHKIKSINDILLELGFKKL